MHATMTMTATARGGSGGATFRSSAAAASERRAAAAPDSPPGRGSELAASKPETAVVDIDIDDDGREDAIKLPQSTHSLLFTEDCCSPPFLFASLVAVVTIACLALSLWDNLSGRTPGNPLNVPANVHAAVRAAQFLSVLVALTMEEEIPTGTHLLRQITRDVVEGRLRMSYNKFVASAMIRLSIGYMFLMNTFLVIVQSRRVLDMFYDMLALNFIAVIDDIAFTLAKSDVLGKSLRVAAGAKCFRAEFEKRPYALRKGMTIFVKVVYVLNLALFIVGITTVAVLQSRGHFQCGSISVSFGENVWERAWVKSPHNDTHSQMILLYSYFNGKYVQNGTHARRPRYRETRKSDNGNFYETKVGAEIKYCEEEGAWVFTHEYITKSTYLEQEESDCQWLLRSPDTDSYDVMDVMGDWSIWVGKIEEGVDLGLACNECKTDIECNLNGPCRDKKCQCDPRSGYRGHRCHLEESCPYLIGTFGGRWSLLYDSQCDNILQYDRPVYSLQVNMDNMTNGLTVVDEIGPVRADDVVNLIFTGSRWFIFKIEGGKNESLELKDRSTEYHAFWDEALVYEILAVSDPTSRSFPVGLDFYRIGEKNSDHGPFGVLWPLQEPAGSGMFHCDDNATDLDAAALSNYHTHSYCSEKNSIG